MFPFLSILTSQRIQQKNVNAVPNPSCIDVTGKTEVVTIQYNSTHENHCITAQTGGFVIVGQSLEIPDSMGNYHKDAFGAGAGTYSIYSSVYPQTLKIYAINGGDASEILLNTKSNWQGSVSYNKQIENGHQKTYYNQIMTIINTNKLQGSVEARENSLITYNGQTMTDDEIEIPSTELVQIGAKPQNEKTSGTHINLAKVDIHISGPLNELPEKIIHVISGQIFTATTPDIEIIDYASSLGYRSGSNKATIIVLSVIAVLLFCIIIFLIVWFIVLKKPCCRLGAILIGEGNESLTVNLL